VGCGHEVSVTRPRHLWAEGKAGRQFRGEVRGGPRGGLGHEDRGGRACHCFLHELLVDVFVDYPFFSRFPVRTGIWFLSGARDVRFEHIVDICIPELFHHFSLFVPKVKFKRPYF